MDQKSMAGHAQAFAREADNLRRLQMMQKKGAANGVKTIVTKGKRQRVAADSGVARAEVRWSAVQDDWPRSDSRSGQRLLRSCSDVAFSAGDVHPGNIFQLALPCYSS